MSSKARIGQEPSLARVGYHRPMNRLDGWMPVLGLLLPGGLLVGCLDGSPVGVVHEIRSQQPVAGAKVELDCRKYELHGTSLVRTVSQVTDGRGRYRFNRSDVDDCDVILARVSKSDFVDAAQIPNSAIQVPFVESGQVPSHVYLARSADVSRLQLEGLLQQSDAIQIGSVPKGSEAAAHALAYETVGKSLSRSLKIATTREEIAWVREHYCRRLEARWNALTESERAEAARFADVDSRGQLAASCVAVPSPASAPS